MGYVGVPPQSGFITTAKQRITSSTNNYVDLDHSISSLADVIVFVNFVKQDYTNLTLTTSSRITLGATLVASDIVEIAYLGKAVATQNPSTNSVTNDMLVNSSITLNGSAVSLGSSATVGGDNTPSFEATRSSDQTLSSSTYAKIQFDTETFDTNSAYDNSTNYRFTVPSGQAGKYYIYASATLSANAQTEFNFGNIVIYKNGSEYRNLISDHRANPVYRPYLAVQAVMVLAVADYIEIYGRVNSGVTPKIQGTNANYFGGYKIIEW